MTKNNLIITPYLNFNGRCEEALEFYGGALGAKVGMLMRFKDNPEPPPPGCTSPGTENKVMHASFSIGEATLMASDGRCSGSTKIRRLPSVDRRGHRRGGGKIFRRAGRGRRSSNAAGEDVLLAEFRHGHRQVRRDLDDHGARRESMNPRPIPFRTTNNTISRKKSIMSTTNEYMLIFRGTDWHKGLSPEQMQNVAGQWMAWFKRLTEEGKAIAGNPLENRGKLVSGKNGASWPTGRLRNRRKRSGGIFS